MDSNEKPLSGHFFRVGATFDLLEQGELHERIMLGGGWREDSNAMKCLRSRVCETNYQTKRAVIIDCQQMSYSVWPD